MLANQMTKLLNQIERRLGTRLLNLPKEISKESWQEIIIEDTINVFSQYFPHRLPYKIKVNELNRQLDGWYLLDEDLLGPNVTILGIKDINYEALATDAEGNLSMSEYGVYSDMVGSTYSIDDIMYGQLRADQNSIFNNGIFVDFEYPNRIRFTSSTGSVLTNQMQSIPVYVFVEHYPNLSTISPTMMKTFEQLARADIATMLYNELKHFENLDTVFGKVSLNLEDLREEANKRDEVIQKLEEGYVTAANHNQALMYCM